jgi:hypothetical protein
VTQPALRDWPNIDAWLNAAPDTPRDCVGTWCTGSGTAAAADYSSGV